VDDKVKNNKNETALHFASQWPNIPSDLFKLILEKSNNVNAQDDEGWTALHCAITHKSEVATKELLNHKDVDVNIKNNNNCTPLHFASNYWRDIPVDLFNSILEKTNDINAQDEDGRTALHWAISENSEIVVKELLNHNDVDVNVKNDYHRTPLHLVSEYWKDIPGDLFKIILEKSTDINAQDKDGKTALHFAILFKSEIMTKALLAHRDVDVSTALGYVSEWEDIPSDLFKLISERSTNNEV
jgi:E3 ubiquitin-protein ligase mind-bomb